MMIYFLRHCKTQNNIKGLISGQSDVDILNTVADSIMNPELNLDECFCSPLKRCIQTYELYKNSFTEHTLFFDERLKERNMGDIENLHKHEAYACFPELFIIQHDRLFFNPMKTPPHGESFEYFFCRISDFFNDHIIYNSNKTILISSHNQTLKVLYYIYKGMDTFNLNSWVELTFSNGLIYNLESLDYK